MFEFWFAAILMSAAVFGVAFVFIRASFNANNESQLDDNRVNDNLRLYQQRLSELDQLLALGDIDTQAHSSLVLEARAQLVVDLNSPLSLTADEDFEESD